MPPQNSSYLIRSVDFRSTGESGDGRTLEGYAAVFNQDTEINSAFEGQFLERIAPNSFAKTLREHPSPKMQFDHGRDSRVGSVPIGAFTEIREDGKGLFVRARLHDNPVVEPIRQAIESGAISGMSFKFRVVKDEWRDSAGKVLTPDEAQRLSYAPGTRGPLQRTIREVQLAEAGPVVFPRICRNFRRRAQYRNQFSYSGAGATSPRAATRLLRQIMKIKVQDHKFDHLRSLSAAEQLAKKNELAAQGRDIIERAGNVLDDDAERDLATVEEQIQFLRHVAETDARLMNLAMDERNLEAGTPFTANEKRGNTIRDDAMRTLERSVTSKALPAHAAEKVQRLLANPSESNLTARWAIATGNESYRGAFAKLVADPRTRTPGVDPRRGSGFP